MRQLAITLGCLAGLSAIACWVVLLNGWTLYYGDAEAHLEIARRIVDSRTPGYPQIGTVWLPLPHALMLPFIGIDGLWRSGLAGVIPSAACFVIAGAFLFAAARRIFKSAAAGALATAVFALNPNLLYLQATPMTEAALLACVMALVYFLAVYADTKSWLALAAAAVANLLATLTRYEGWFLLPFAAMVVFALSPGKRITRAAAFACIAALGPLYWLIHNAIIFGDPLEFYRGPYSALAINGGAHYPGEHDWRKSIEYVATVARAVCGWTAVALGIAGAVAALARRVWWPLALLAMIPVFYVLSMYSSGTPISVPWLSPHGYYNTRYGLCALPFLALASGAVVFLMPERARTAFIALAALFIAIVWAVQPAQTRAICWKESQVNSDARRAWTQAAAGYLTTHYDGGGLFSSFGDMAGVYREANIPLRQALNECNEPQWIATVARPDLFLKERWVLAQAGDAIDRAMTRASVHGPRFECVKVIDVPGARRVCIYRRTPVTAAALADRRPLL